MYSFAELDSNTLLIKPSDPDFDIDQNGYNRFTALKNGNLKTMIAVGGWGDSAEGNGPEKYSRLVSSQANINSFVQSVLNLLQQHNFDGLDVVSFRKLNCISIKIFYLLFLNQLGLGISKVGGPIGIHQFADKSPTSVRNALRFEWCYSDRRSHPRGW